MSDYLQKLFGLDGQRGRRDRRHGRARRRAVRGTGAGRGDGRRRRPQRRARRRARRGDRKSWAARRRSPKSMPPIATRSRRCSRTARQATRPCRCAGELRGRQFADALFRYQRRRVRPHRQHESARHALGLPDFRQAHDRRGRRSDSEHRQRDQLPAAVARVHLLRVESGRAESDAKRGPRVGPARRARQLPVPRLLPGRAEPQNSRQVARRIDPPSHADGPARRRTGARSAPCCCCSRRSPAASSPAKQSTSTVVLQR